MENTNTYWTMKNGEKVYKKEYSSKNEDKAVDYKMETILAGLTLTDNFNENEYYSHRMDMERDLK
jgi:hypothetical protein